MRQEDATLIPSRSEIEALCSKAARATGLEWGLAEEAGRAVAVLEKAGLPGLDWFLAWLDEPGGAVLDIVAPEGAGLCPIRSGTVINDHAPPLPLDLADVIVPALLIGFLLRCATGFELAWAGGRARGGWAGCVIEGMAPPLRGAVTLRPALQSPAPGGPAPRRPFPVAGWQRLTSLALTLTVPATAGSRSGAGAGSHDND